MDEREHQLPAASGGSAQGDSALWSSTLDGSASGGSASGDSLPGGSVVGDPGAGERQLDNLLSGDSPSPVIPEARDENSSRRSFLHGSARKLAYAAPLILLFHPKQACASNGSTLTYWDEGSGSIKHR